MSDAIYELIQSLLFMIIILLLNLNHRSWKRDIEELLRGMCQDRMNDRGLISHILEKIKEK